MTKTIEIFKRGTQTDSAGTKIAFDDETLEGIASFANTGAFQVPGVIGHPKDNDPAVCWGKSYAYNRQTGILTAEVDETDPAFAEMLTKKMYNKVSSSFFGPTSPANPNPGNFSLRHIGFLGAAAPAVTGLAPVNFAAAADTHDFSDWDDADTAGLFRSMRDWILSKFGQADADAALPAYTVTALQENAAIDLASPELADVANAFTEAGTQTPAIETPAAIETPVVQEAAVVVEMPAEAPGSKTALAGDYTEREAALNAREAALAAKENALAAADFSSFCAQLGASGQLNGDEQHDRAAAIFESLQGSTTIDFAEEGAVSATKLFKDLLAGLPASVTFSEVAREAEAPTPDSVNFVAPQGEAVDQAGLVIMAKAHSYMKQHPGTDLIAALKQINPL